MSNRFKQLDTNADNSVDRNEFIAGAPDDVSSDQAGKLFDKLDSKGKGSLSQDDLASAFQQMASTMQSTLIQAQASQNGSTTSSDGTQTTGSHRHHHHDGDGPDAAQMFSKLDANGDGTLTKDEFVAGRPSDVGEDQAGAFYDKIAAASGAESTATGLTKDQLATGLEKTRPDQTGSAQSAAAGSTSSDDQLQALLEQLLSTIQSQLASSGSSSDSAGTSQNGDQGPPDPSKMFAALDTNHDGTVTRDEFLAGRPSDVSETQAGSFYDKIASASGADSSSGLSQDQLAEGMKKAGPPDDTASSTLASAQSTSNEQLLQELLKAISSYQKTARMTNSGTVLAA